MTLCDPVWRVTLRLVRKTELSFNFNMALRDKADTIIIELSDSSSVAE